jgi:DNA-binding transcriptional LysR family regulator
VRDLNIELIRTFVAVVEGESFAAASIALHRTQSAITQQIQRLEQQIGKPLFCKVGRNKRLTEDGVRLLGYARRMLAINDEAWSSLTGSALTGEVRIGAPHDVSETILPHLLTRFSTEAPDLRMSIHVGRSPFLMQAMKRGEIDMTVSTRDDPEHRRVTLRTSPVVWVSSASYRYDRNLPVPLVVPDEPSLYRSIALEALGAAHMECRISYTSPTLLGVRAAVRAGLGITARSIEMLGPDFRTLGPTDGLPRLQDVSFHLYLSNRPSNPAVQHLFEMLATHGV